MATTFRQLTAWQQPDNSISSVWQKIWIVLSKSAVVSSLIACCSLYGRILWQKHSIFGTLCFCQILSYFLISVQKWFLWSTCTRSRITSMWLASTAQTSGGSPFRSFLWIRAPLQSLISNNQNITLYNTVDPGIPYFKILVQLFPSSYFWVLTGSLFSLWIFTPALVRSGSSLSSLHWKKDGALGKISKKEISPCRDVQWRPQVIISCRDIGPLQVEWMNGWKAQFSERNMD